MYRKIKNFCESRSYIFFRKSFFLIGLVLFSLILFSNLIVFLTSFGKSHYNLNTIENKKIAIVLGTSKYISDGGYNLFYKARIDAAEEIIKSKKVQYLLLSGTKDGAYNEPQMMKDDLLRRGVNETKIFLDNKGDRTWDSIIRMKEVFKEDDFIIISQQFHAQRALFIANLKGLSAEAFLSKNPPLLLSIKIYSREFFARIKLLGDIFFQSDIKYIDEIKKIP